MTASTAVRFSVVGTARRRVVTLSPGARPNLRLPRLRPAAPFAPGRVASVSSCRVVSVPQSSRWLAVKVAAVAVVALVGGVVSAAEIVAGATSPGPASGYVAGDPAWAHVAQP